MTNCAVTNPAHRDSDAGTTAGIVARALVVLGLLYLFLAGVSMLERGINTLGSDVQDSLFDNVSNPLVGLLVGVLATVLVQSSSVTTATIVTLVGSGVLTVDEAVPMIMGANIGTTVTNTLASLGHVRKGSEFERAFAAATVHDFFNILAVAIFLPLELATGFLSSSAEWLAEKLVGTSGAEWDSPIKEVVEYPVNWLTDIFEALGASGNVLAGLLIISALVLIFTSLAFITKNMRALIADRIEQTLNRVLGSGGGVTAMFVGLLVTVAVQSSSITTSILVPLAGAGILKLENAYPVTLGANVGTTITALLASLATGEPTALTVALTHTLFNVAGIALLYPIPPLRVIPLKLARGLSRAASENTSVVLFYVVTMFVVIPVVGIAVLR
ncbi:MAG: Na/Pi symporter [Acidobacteria bacterium]|nr:Na/Pi symporter [Acidobacteriota bacterium]